MQREHQGPFDGRALGEQVVTTVRDFVSRSLRPIAARLDALTEKLDRHAERVATTDALLDDLDRRLADVEQLARQREERSS